MLGCLWRGWMGGFVGRPSGAPCWQSLRSLREGDLVERLGPCSASLFFFLWSPLLLSQLFPWSPCALWKGWRLTFCQIHVSTSIFLALQTWHPWVLMVVELRECRHHFAEMSNLEKTTLEKGKMWGNLQSFSTASPTGLENWKVAIFAYNLWTVCLKTIQLVSFDSVQHTKPNDAVFPYWPFLPFLILS